MLFTPPNLKAVLSEGALAEVILAPGVIPALAAMVLPAVGVHPVAAARPVAVPVA